MLNDNRSFRYDRVRCFLGIGVFLPFKADRCGITLQAFFFIGRFFHDFFRNHRIYSLGMRRVVLAGEGRLGGFVSVPGPAC